MFITTYSMEGKLSVHYLHKFTWKVNQNLNIKLELVCNIYGPQCETNLYFWLFGEPFNNQSNRLGQSCFPAICCQLYHMINLHDKYAKILQTLFKLYQEQWSALDAAVDVTPLHRLNHSIPHPVYIRSGDTIMSSLNMIFKSLDYAQFESFNVRVCRQIQLVKAWNTFTTKYAFPWKIFPNESANSST